MRADGGVVFQPDVKARSSLKNVETTRYSIDMLTRNAEPAIEQAGMTSSKATARGFGVTLVRHGGITKVLAQRILKYRRMLRSESERVHQDIRRLRNQQN